MPVATSPLAAFSLRPIAAAAGLLLSMLAPAHAQDAPKPPASADEAQKLDKVVVTATRRREPIRDVPLSVAVVDPEALQDAGAKNLQDYVMGLPGVNVSVGGRNNSVVTMRGVASSGQSSATVGMYVDDVPVGSAHAFGDGASAYDQQLLDLSRIEVLKGPQGTLYGASAMGGLMKYVTAEPDTRQLSGSVGLQASTTKSGGAGYTVNGIVNAPLSEGVAGLRASAFYSKEGGYVDATGLAGGKDINSADSKGARLSLLLKPVRDLTVRLSGQVQTASSDNRSFVDWDFANQHTKGGDLERLDLRVPEPQYSRNSLLTATVEYDLGWARISSITGKQREDVRSNGDYSIIYSIFVPTITRSLSTIHPTTDKTTQEFRIVSQTRGSFDWLAGLFYADETTGLGQNIYQATAAQPDFKQNPLLYGPDAGFFAKYQELAAYGTGTWNMTPAFALTAGVRFSKNDLDVTQKDGGLFASNTNSAGTSHEKPTTYLLAARYKLNADSSVYARAASGYRPGGPNLAVLGVNGQSVNAQPNYKSDSLRSYEAGYKAALPNNLGSVEASIYEIDWSDIQVIGFLDGGNFRTNAGMARIRGVELSSTLRPTQSLTLTAAASALDAKLTEASPIGTQTAPAGSRLPYSARLSANASARYDFAVSSHNANVALTASYVGDRNTQFDGITSAPNYRLPSFTEWDLTGGLELSRTLSLGAYVRNLTDSRGLLNVDTSQTNFGGATLASLTRPRTIGVTLKASF